MTTDSTTQASKERELLDGARDGDDEAFRRLVEPYRRELHAHCYRMLGSVHDAEDALQDTLLRAWRGLAGFERRSSLRTWLHKIATTASLDVIARRRKRVLPIDYGPAADPHDGPGEPLVESAWVEPYPDELMEVGDGRLGPAARYEQRESVELAFIAALQFLPARQRAVLILREVLGYSAKEAAEALDASVASVNSALQRARKAMDERLPAESQQRNLRSIGDGRLKKLVDDYLRAWEAGDVDGILVLLTEDATLTMPPMPTWYRGRDAVEVFLAEWAFASYGADQERVRGFAGERSVRLVPTTASGQVAFGGYHWDPAEGSYRPVVLQVLTLRGDKVREIDGFVDPAMFERFGLPERLSGR
jgi:RNA polymerase sigma-70 factor (ECF subfamily)